MRNEAKQRHGLWRPVILVPRATQAYLKRLQHAGLVTVATPLLGSRAVRQLPAERGIDLVHAHGYEANYLVAGLRCVSRRWSRLPAVVTAHGWIETTPRLQIMSALDRLGARTADVRIASAYAHSSRSCLRGRYPPLVIRNGVSEQPPERLADLQGERDALRTRLAVLPSGFLAGTVGRLSSEKRIDLLFTATRRIAMNRPESHLLVVGGGERRAALESLARRLGIRERVTFTGLLTDMNDTCVRCARLLVQPSDTEGTPRTVLRVHEAYALAIRRARQRHPGA